jgi:predicted phage terminase large subunit-like protein
LHSPDPSKDFPPSSSDDWLKQLDLGSLTEPERIELHRLATKSLAKTDQYAFGEYVFGYQAAEHHVEMCDAIDEAWESKSNVVILEPRGGAKTTWGNTIKIAKMIADNPDIRIGLISNTAKQANDFSRAIRWTFESNTEFRELYGHLVSTSKWTDVEWLRAGSRWHGSKDVTLYAAGAGGAIISKRFDIIFCDDILDEENCANIEQREKIQNWFFKTLIPCLVPHGVVVILGTRWAEEDLYEVLTTPIDRGGKGWKLITRKALIEHEDGSLESYWPEHWPVDLLLQKKVELGSALFACAYQNDISGLMSGNVFRRESFDYFDTLDPDKHYTIRMGVDLASSERERADFTARVVTAEDEDGNFYVLSVVRDKRETHHAEFIYDGWAAFPDMGLVICESQQFQSTLIQEVMQDYPRIPIEGKKSDVDKVTRARAVAAKYEAHRIKHHRSLRDSDFERELLSFPKGHDDMVDALGFSFDLGGGGLVFGSLRR